MKTNYLLSKGVSGGTERLGYSAALRRPERPAELSSDQPCQSRISSTVLRETEW